MTEYRSNEDYNSFENELREAFRVARDQLNQEEVRIINLYRNMPKRAYHRTSRKDAIIEQLTEIRKDIGYKLVSPKLESIRDEVIVYFNKVIKQSLEEQDVPLTEGAVNSIVNDQLEEFGQELQKSRETLYRIMYGSFLSDQSNSILQKMHGLKSKLADSVKGRSIGEVPAQLLVPDGSRAYASDINPYITDAKRSKTETGFSGMGQTFHKPTEGMHTEPELRSSVPEPTLSLLPPTSPLMESRSPILGPTLSTPPHELHESIEPVEAPKPKLTPVLEPITAKGKPPDYKCKGRSIKSAGKFGTNVGEFKMPKGIAFDSVDNRIFIADSSNVGKGIQIYSVSDNNFNLMEQTFLTKPHAIAVSDEYIFVTDVERNVVVQFNIDSFEYETHNGGIGNLDSELNTPSGLCVDNKLNVYVADNKNNRISVFEARLKFKEHIGVGSLFEPKDVKLTKDTIAVLDTADICLHFFSRKTGGLIRSCITMGKGNDVMRPIFFFIDPHLNILISDQFGHSIQIFDQGGQKVHTIGGTAGHGEGQLFSPAGLFVSKTGEIVVVSSNKTNILQYF